MSIKRANAKTTNRKGEQSTAKSKGVGAPLAILTIRDSKSKPALIYKSSSKLGRSKILDFTRSLIYLVHLVPLSRSMKSISWSKDLMELLNGLNAKEITLSVKWGGVSSGRSSRTSTRAIRKFNFEL